MSDSPSSPADWYEDPEDPAQYRYWDGMRWTDHRAPRAAAPQPAAPAYGYTAPGYAVPGYATGAPVLGGVPPQPILAGPLLAAGGLLILAGVGRAVSYLLPYELYAVTLLFSAVEVIGWAGAYALFLVAGYPSRRRAPRVLAAVLIGIYLLSGALTLALSALPLAGRLSALLGLFGFVTLGVGIAFGISAVRSAETAPRLRFLPLALYVGLILFGILTGIVTAAVATGSGIPWQATLVVGAISGIVPIAIGVLFLLFGRTPNATSVTYPAPAAENPTV